MALDATVIGRVAIKVIPDTGDLRSDTRREVEAATSGLEAEIGFTADVQDAVREVRRALDDAQRAAQSVTIRFDVDNESEALAALRTIDRERARVDGNRVELNVDLNRDDLEAARELIQEQVDQAARVRIELDNAAFAATQERVERELRQRFDNLDLRIFEETDARESIRRLVEEIDGLQVQLTPEISDRERARLEAEIDSREARISVALNELTVRQTSAELALLARNRDVELFPTLNAGATSRALAAIAALAGTRNISALRQDIDRTIGSLDRLAPAIALAATQVAELSSLALSTAGNVLALGSSLASTAQAGLALPGIVAGLGIGLGATVAVLRDFNDQLPEVGDQLGALRRVMSERFYVRALEPMREFIDTILPEFSAGLLNTSDALGTFFAELAASGTDTFAGTLAPMFAGLNESILISSGYTDAFVGIIQKLGAVGAAELPGLARFFGDTLAKFDAFLASKGTDGLRDSIAEGTQALQDLGGVIVSTGSLFAGLSRAATAGGGTTLAALRDTLEGAANAVNSAGFQSKLAQVFRAAYEGTQAIADAAGDDFRELTSTIANLLDRVLPSAGRAIGTLAEGLFDALNEQGLSNSVVGLFDGIENAAGDIAPSLDELADGLSGVIDVTTALVETLADSLGPIIENLSPLIGDVARELIPFIELLGDVTNTASDLATGLIGALPAGLVAAGLAVGATALAVNKLRGLLAALAAGFATSATRAQALRTGLTPLQASMVGVGAATATATGSLRAFATSGIANIARVTGKAALGLGALAFAASGAAESVGLTNSANLALLGSLAGPFGALAGAVGGAFLDLRADANRAEKALHAFDEELKNPEASIQSLGESLRAQVADFEAFSDASRDAASSFGGYLKALGSNQGRGAIVDSLDGTNDRLAEQRDQILKNATDVRVLADNLNLLGKAANANAADYESLFGNVNKGLAEFDTSALDNLRAALAKPADNPNAVLDQLGNLEDIYARVKPVLDQMGLSIGDLQKSLNAEEAITFGQEFLAAAKYLDSTKKKFDDVSTAVTGLNDATLTAALSADALKKSLDALFSPTLNAEEALDQYDTTLKEFGATIRENGTNFQGFSDGAKANREAARAVVSDLSDVLVTQAELGSSSVEVALRIQQMRQQFIDTATAAGVGKTAAEGLAAAYKLTPDLVTTVFQQTGIKLSKREIDSLLGSLGKLPRSVVTSITENGVPKTRAAVKKLADQLNLTKGEYRVLLKLAGFDRAKTEVDNTKKSVDRLAGAKVDVEVIPKNTARADIKNTKADADSLSRKKAKVTIEATDRASAVINAVATKLTNLNGRSAKVSVSHITTYSSRNLGSSGGKPEPDRKTGRQIVNDTANAAERSIVDLNNTANRAVADVNRKAVDSIAESNRAAGRAVVNLQAQTAVHTANTNALVSDAGKRANQSIATTARTANRVTALVTKDFKANFSTALDAFINQTTNAYEALLRKFKKKSDQARLKRLFAADIADLKELSRAHDRLMKQYEREAAKLKALKDEAKQYRQQVKDTIISSGDVTQLGAVTYDGIVRGLEEARDRAVRFQKAIAGLIKQGLNATTLQQILAAGPEAGLAAAESILKGGVSTINDIQAEIDKAASSTASAAGQALYGPLIDNAQKAVNELVKKLAPLQKALREFATDLIDALRDQLRREAVNLGIAVEYQGPRPGRGTRNGTAVAAAQPFPGRSRAASGSMAPVSNKTLIYNAAPGKSFDSEEDLFDALGKAGGFF